MNTILMICTIPASLIFLVASVAAAAALDRSDAAEEAAILNRGYGRLEG